MTVQRQAQADRDACDRLLKAIFDRGLGQRQIARVAGIPLSTVQRALQRVIYPYRQDRPIGNMGDAYFQDAPTWKKRRAKLESLAIDQLQPTRGSTAGTQGQAPKIRIACRKSKATLQDRRRHSRVTLEQHESDLESPALQGHASEGRNSQAGAVAKAEPTESKIKAARVRAKLAIHPSANAAMVIEQFGDHFGDLDLAALVGHLKDSLNDISKNDLRSCEAMLYSHAHALQAIFVSSALRAAADQEWGMNNYETHMRVALKAQSQCRATLETLATIKNPPVVFARQANIAAGHQQVNNAMMPAGEPRAGGENENTPDKLSEGSNGRLLPDTGAPGAAVGSDPAMAPLGTFDRAEVRRG